MPRSKSKAPLSFKATFTASVEIEFYHQDVCELLSGFVTELLLDETVRKPVFLDAETRKILKAANAEVSDHFEDYVFPFTGEQSQHFIDWLQTQKLSFETIARLEAGDEEMYFDTSFKKLVVLYIKENLTGTVRSTIVDYCKKEIELLVKHQASEVSWLDRTTAELKKMGYSVVADKKGRK